MVLGSYHVSHENVLPDAIALNRPTLLVYYKGETVLETNAARQPLNRQGRMMALHLATERRLTVPDFPFTILYG